MPISTRLVSTASNLFAFEITTVAKAGSIIAKMGEEGWRLEAWQSNIDADDIYLVLCFTRPKEERVMVDIGTLHERVRTAFRNAFDQERRSPVTPEELTFYHQGQQAAYADVLDKIDQIVGC